MSDLIQFELNELNIELVRKYCELGKMPNFSKILDEFHLLKTNSEENYDEVEPWIQWVTAHTGLEYSEHKIFRLGDIKGADIPQIYDVLTERGITFGVVSPMNAENRYPNCKFFIPDPWTGGLVTGSKFTASLYEVISKFVNNNANGKISFKDLIILGLGFLKFSQPKFWTEYIRLAVSSRKGNKWRRALFLDLLLFDIYKSLLKKEKPQYSSVFFNAAAHIQHHYLYNSRYHDGPHKNPTWYINEDMDPVYEAYKLYDKIVGELIKLDSKYKVIATGLHQDPYGTVEFYWRLTDHKKFLEKLGIHDVEVQPRMSRDFLVFSDNHDELDTCSTILENTVDNENQALFTVDRREKTSFVTLKYRRDISNLDFVAVNEKKIEISKEDFAFVAIKNGHHNPIGYILGDSTEKYFKKRNTVKLSELFNYTLWSLSQKQK